jgi:serine/threonine-protein kinase
LTLQTGTRLGPYEIVGTLGAGGMGEVYRARDTRLGRSVAIKVLPSELAGDPKVRARFEREAKAVSALNHPHICTLHDIGREDGVDFLVMEHCEGKTLARRIADGPLPIDRVITYGMQIADALDKAHRQGIVHRDLKPSNVMVTKSGVKVLDFGLARQQVDLTPDDATIEQVSEAGMLLGTVQYMAPEVLTGQPADARSDIFALGLILYEMTTGKPAFPANSRAELIAAILEREPESIQALYPAVPDGLVRVISACTAKSADDRIQSAHDVMLELKWTAEKSASTEPPLRTSWVAATAAFALGALITAGIAVVLLRKPHIENAGIRRLSIALPPEAPVTTREGPGSLFAISPDEKRLVYVGPQRALYVRNLDSLAVNVLPGTEGATNPFFSPDGNWIGFEAARSLKKVPVAGGNPVTICERVTVRGAVWRDDDTIIFGQALGPPMRVPASAGDPKPLSSSTSVRWPALLPGASEILVTVYDESGNPDRNELALLSAEGKLSTILRSASHGQYATTGHLLFLRSGSVYRVPFDAQTKKIAGKPEPALHDVAVLYAQGFAHVTARGKNLYYVPHDPAMNERQLLWVDRRGAAVPVVEKRQHYGGASGPKLSPDGEQVLVEICARGECDIWRYEIERAIWNRVTSNGRSVTACWSPDGQFIAYASNRDGPPNLFVIRSDGSGQPRQITFGQSWVFPQSWSPDGKHIAVFEGRPATTGDISLIAVQDGTRTPYLETSDVESSPAFSPDGRWLAYTSSDAAGGLQVFLRATDGSGPAWKVTDGGGAFPRWRGDGKELFYRHEKAMLSVSVTTNGEVRLGKPTLLFQGDFAIDYDVSGDGQRFLMMSASAVTPRTEIRVVEGLLD